MKFVRNGLFFIIFFSSALSAADKINFFDYLVGHWKFNESNHHVKDYSGNNNHGKVIGTLQWNSDAGFEKGAFLFDGIHSNKIAVPYSQTIDITGDEVSIVARIKIRNCPKKGTMGQILKHLQTSTPGGYQLEINGNKNCSVRFVYRTGDTMFTSGKGISLTPGKWYQVAGGKSKSHIWTAVNGLIDISIPSKGKILSNHQDLMIGGQISPRSGGTTFDGWIDDLFLFRKSLSDTELKYLQNLN